MTFPMPASDILSQFQVSCEALCQYKKHLT